MQGSKLPMVADANLLYKDLHDAIENHRELSQVSNDIGDERLAVYDAMKAVTGLGEPVNPENRDKQVKGILKTVLG
jgi:hypothetical protein